MQVDDDFLTQADTLFETITAFFKEQGITGNQPVPVLGANIGPHDRPMTYLQATLNLSGHESLRLVEYRTKMGVILQTLRDKMGWPWELDLSLNRDGTVSMTFVQWNGDKMNTTLRDYAPTFSDVFKKLQKKHKS